MVQQEALAARVVEPVQDRQVDHRVARLAEEVKPQVDPAAEKVVPAETTGAAARW